MFNFRGVHWIDPSLIEHRCWYLDKMLVAQELGESRENMFHHAILENEITRN